MIKSREFLDLVKSYLEKLIILIHVYTHLLNWPDTQHIRQFKYCPPRIPFVTLHCIPIWYILEHSNTVRILLFTFLFSTKVFGMLASVQQCRQWEPLLCLSIVNLLNRKGLNNNPLLQHFQFGWILTFIHYLKDADIQILINSTKGWKYE